VGYSVAVAGAVSPPGEVARGRPGKCGEGSDVGYDGQIYRELLDDSGLAVVVHGPDGAVVEANQAFADMLGYTLTEALALTAAQVIHPEDKAQRDADAGRLLGGQLPNLATERRLIAKDGSTIWARVRKSVRHQDGQMVVIVIIEDWTTQHEQVTRLEYAADHDELTGLLNRRGLWARIEVAGQPIHEKVLALIDVNGLKDINDRHGHAAGDLLLAGVARSLTALSRPGWVTARLAGDEFVLLAPAKNVTAAALARTVRTKVATLLFLPDAGTVVPSVAVGTAELPAGGVLAHALREADTAMYADKRRSHHDRRHTTRPQNPRRRAALEDNTMPG